MSWSNLRAQEKCIAEIQDKIKLPEKTTYGPRWVLTLTNAHPRHVPGCLRWTDAAGSGEVGPVPWDRNLLVRLIYDAWVCDMFAYIYIGIIMYIHICIYIYNNNNNMYIYIYINHGCVLILCNCICIHIHLSIWRFVSVYTYVSISSMHNMWYLSVYIYTFALAHLDLHLVMFKQHHSRKYCSLFPACEFQGSSPELAPTNQDIPNSFPQ